MISNDEFMKELEEDYPDMDWDKLSPLEDSPDIWKIDGMMNRRMRFLPQPTIPEGKEWTDSVGFGIDHEYTSLKEAEAKLESMKTDPHWCEELLFEDKSDGPMPHIEYHGPVIWESVKIIKTKPWKDVSLHMTKSFREDILAGKKVFPMYLP